MRSVALLFAVLVWSSAGICQTPDQFSPQAEQPAIETPASVQTGESPVASESNNGLSSTADEGQTPAGTTLKEVSDQTKELASQTKEKVSEIAETLDKTAAAKNVSAGLLKPIYTVAESLAFPAFYWISFALMVAGTVSYAFQLVLGKVVVLSKGSMNIREIMSDSVGLAICVIGLVLTTQAATENSTFPQTPSSVLSATIAGAVLGLCLYRWGQAEEVDAAMGRRKATSAKK